MSAFKKMFGKYLLVTNTVSCGLMMAIGDLMQQRSDFLRKHIVKSNEPELRLCDQRRFNLEDEEDELENLVRLVSRSEELVATTNESLDYVRTRNMTLVGLFQGPFHHYFYHMLERYLPGKNVYCIFKKTLVDQAIASPVCLGIFFFGLGALEQKNLRDINGEVRLKLLDTWKVDCMFWPPTQFVNFLFIPIRYRVIYINVMTVFYDIFLSYIKYDAQFQ